jgi:hypothetical protein
MDVEPPTSATSTETIRRSPAVTDMEELYAAVLLPLALPELFDTAELAQAAGIERRLAQADDLQVRAMRVLDAAGKRSGAVLHRAA